MEGSGASSGTRGSKEGTEVDEGVMSLIGKGRIGGGGFSTVEAEQTAKEGEESRGGVGKLICVPVQEPRDERVEARECRDMARD